MLLDASDRFMIYLTLTSPAVLFDWGGDVVDY